jgi:hypothetical protein
MNHRDIALVDELRLSRIEQDWVAFRPGDVKKSICYLSVQSFIIRFNNTPPATQVYDENSALRGVFRFWGYRYG